MTKLILFWLMSLAVVAVVASTLTRAQSRLTDARIVSGDDVGFRVEGMDHNGNPAGTFVVRLNGEWVAVGSMPAVRPANEVEPRGTGPRIGPTGGRPRRWGTRRP